MNHVLFEGAVPASNANQKIKPYFKTVFVVFFPNPRFSPRIVIINMVINTIIVILSVLSFFC